MRLDNFIQTAMNNVLKNPVLSVLRDINFSSIICKRKGSLYCDEFCFYAYGRKNNK